MNVEEFRAEVDYIKASKGVDTETAIAMTPLELEYELETYADWMSNENE